MLLCRSQRFRFEDDDQYHVLYAEKASEKHLIYGRTDATGRYVLPMGETPPENDFTLDTVAAAGYNESETYLLGRLVHGEARGEPYVGKVAVAAVVLNRVKSSSFPNTISGVIYQAGAFDAVADGQINLTPDEDSLRAARDALNGWDPTGGCLYYYNPVTATNSWIWSRTVQLSIGKHNFAI